MDSRSAAVPSPARVEHAVAHSLATASRSDQVYRAVLATIGGWLGWELGAAWEIAPPTREHLRCVEIWCAPGTDASGFEELTRRTRLARGVGLPGRVWESGDPRWIPDVTLDPKNQAKFTLDKQSVSVAQKQKEVVKVAERTVEQKRREMAEAAKELKAIEKHRETWQKQIRAERAAKEELTQEEIGNALFLSRQRK